MGIISKRYPHQFIGNLIEVEEMVRASLQNMTSSIEWGLYKDDIRSI